MQYTSEYPIPGLAADVLLLADDSVLLICRRNKPFKGRLALPGGFVNEDETFAQAAQRELLEETGIDIAVTNADFVELLDHPKRDPRLRMVSAVFRVELDYMPTPKPADDAVFARWTPLAELDPSTLAFDHARVVFQHTRNQGLVNNDAGT